MSDKISQVSPLNLDTHRFLEALRFVTESLTGQVNLAPFETRVQALQDRIPLVVYLTGAAGSALEKITTYRDGSAALDTETLREFLNHNEVFCHIQGALAALIIVGEELARQESEAKVKQKARTPRKKKDH